MGHIRGVLGADDDTGDPNRFMVAASSFQNAFSGVLKEFPTIPIHKNILVPRMGGDEQNKRMAIEAVRQLQASLPSLDWVLHFSG
mgnify:CR=1 FL=1